MSFSVEPTVTEKDITLLNNVLKSTVLLRRVKSDPELAKQLPEKVRKVYRIRVEDSKFWKAEKELRIKIKEELRELGIKQDVPVSMKSYSRMRRIVGEAKLPDMIEWIKRWQRNNPKSKLVVTGWHVDLLTKLNEEFPMSYLVTGKVDTHKKYKIGKMFNTKEGHPLLFGNVKSIGTGINLTAADTMLFVELPYTGVDVAQVEDRLHRLCQKAKTVYYFYFIVEGSLEEKLLSYISRKQRTAGAVLDAKATDTLEDVLEDSDRVSPLLLKSLV
jgi:SNF2 family DNA or RNA helicase